MPWLLTTISFFVFNEAENKCWIVGKVNSQSKLALGGQCRSENGFAGAGGCLADWPPLSIQLPPSLIPSVSVSGSRSFLTFSHVHVCVHMHMQKLINNFRKQFRSTSPPYIDNNMILFSSLSLNSLRGLSPAFWSKTHIQNSQSNQNSFFYLLSVYELIKRSIIPRALFFIDTFDRNVTTYSISTTN